MRSRLPLRAGLDRGREVIKGLAAVQGTSGAWELPLGQGGGRRAGAGAGERTLGTGRSRGRENDEAGAGTGAGRRAMGRRWGWEREENTRQEAGDGAGKWRRTPGRGQEEGREQWG